MNEEALKLAQIAPKLMNAFHNLGQHYPKSANLSMRQFQVLIILSANKKTTISQLCKKLRLAASTGTELVNRMISLNYIEKEHEDKDHRQISLSLSPTGFNLLKERQDTLTKMFSDFIAPFKKKDLETFVHCFETISELMIKYNANKK